ncbi:antimicrobial peptides-like [Impatiens glandulifera]|uniref:antimicrobial peptides-like n=1 Tax=Impatiens glandulifera TaxID=253017 RepID=UPI001FB0F6F0|nr:antimicrobial peptides-like [Impatiens glandulifera]
MVHKGVVFGVILLFIFSAIAKADSNPLKEEDKKKPDHVVAGSEPQYSEDQFGRRCCGWGPGRRYCVRWCRNAEEVAAFEAYELEAEEGGGPQYSEDQVGSRCCGWAWKSGQRVCIRWCRNAEEVAALEAYEEEAKEGETQYLEDQFGRRCCGWGPGHRYCVRWC